MDYHPENLLFRREQIGKYAIDDCFHHSVINAKYNYKTNPFGIYPTRVKIIRQNYARELYYNNWSRFLQACRQQGPNRARLKKPYHLTKFNQLSRHHGEKSNIFQSKQIQVPNDICSSQLFTYLYSHSQTPQEL